MAQNHSTRLPVQLGREVGQNYMSSSLLKSFIITIAIEVLPNEWMINDHIPDGYAISLIIYHYQWGATGI